MNASKTLVGVSGLLMLVTLATPGCATKKYVRQTVSPVDQRVSEIDKKHTEALASLEGKEQKDVSRVEERAMSAENKANDAARAAQQADSKATQADQTARNATDLAQQAQTKLGDVTRAVENIDNYKLISSEDVLFGFNKATLTPKTKQELDSLIQQANTNTRYILEVEGFTDRAGPNDYNLALSRRRADAVVRYLVDHNIPLRRIHMIGLGKEQPMADGQTQMTMQGQTPSTMQGQTQTEATGTTSQHRLTTKQMRRVIVKVWVPETTMAASSSAPQSQQMNPPANQQQNPPRQP